MDPSYKLKFKNRDFEVTEVSLMPILLPKTKSKYTYFWLKKEGINTFDSSEKIAKSFRVPPGDLGFEGLKDEDAVTHQLFSIKKVLSGRDIIVFNSIHKKDNIEIERIVGYGNAGLSTRMLHGNVFNIIVKDLVCRAVHSALI